MAGSKPSRELPQRVISGLVIMGGIIGGIYAGGWVWVCITATLALISLAEYYRILARRVKLSKGIGYLCALAVIISSARWIRPVSIVLTLSLSVYAIFMIEMLRRQILRGQSYAVDNVGGTLSGVLFIAVPWTCITLLRDLPTGTLILVSLFACTWGCDVMAFIVGKLWGSEKLCEYISPNKTVQGFIGGAVGSMFVNSALIYFLRQPPYPLFIIGVICGIAGQFGDLAESLVKRELGVKDSGRLIPGHGGALDRFDSILLNGLLTYLVFGVLMQ
ncbi:MAG: phosphatidate cytidylyltransferase [Synergistaceae bacterium]|nr:phosphatidate cytidylyltransferase [Synergistaceae bacterium]